MASRIKGITIEINGSVTGLDKALKDVNSRLSESKSALRDVDRLLKLDPGNVDLLKQKQKYLTEAIEETKRKLDTEKEALAQLKDADKSPEVEKRMEALQRQIANDEAALKKLTEQEKDFGSVAKQQAEAAGAKMEEYGGKIQAAGDKIAGVGKGLTVGVTAPVAAVGAASVKAFNEVDEALDIVVEKTGATGDAFDSMKGIVENIATSIPTSFEAAGTAVGEVNTRFGLTGDALEDLSEKFIMFAELNDTDVSDSVDSVQKALSAFGLNAEDAGHMLDVLNKVGQDTGVSVNTLTAGLVKNGTAFKEMGLSADQAAIFMGQMEKSGANSETVMQGLRKALKNATDEGIPLDQALSNLQDTILNGTGSVDGLTAAYDLFGKSGDQIYGAVRDGTIDFSALGEAAIEAGGSVQDTFESTVDPMDEMQTVMNQLKVTGADLVETAGPMLADVLERVRDVVEKLSEKWNSLDDSQKEMIIKAALIVAAVGPVITMIGGIISGVGGVISMVGGLIPAISGVITVIGPLAAAAAPFLIGGAIIAGIIAGVVMIVKHWDDIKAKAGELKDKVSEKWNGLKEKTAETWDNVKTKTAETWENAKTTVANKAEEIRAKTNEKLTAAKDKISDMWDRAKEKTGSAWDRMKEITASSGEGIFSTVSRKFDAIKDKIGEKMDAAREKVQWAIDKIKGLFNFEWHLPHLKLPHFSWTWKDVGGVIKLPSISVDWYKKAMDTPMILRKPAAFGFDPASGTIMAGGEAGDEVVSGASTLMDMIRKAVESAQQMTNMRQIGMMQQALQTSGVNVTYGDVNMTVYGTAGQDVTELADIVSEKIQKAYDRDRMVWR